jgi:hypothetical protein
MVPWVERTKDSNNFIGGEQKFAFTLEVNNQQPPKCLQDIIFWKFWRQEFIPWNKDCP